jgi:glutamate/tyrosine decarboxylase-like PLP-dependent enzyme
MGLPSEASGIITSGASVANLVGLQVALEAHAPGVRLRGVASLQRRPVVYASTEVHSSLLMAMATLGLGWDSLRRIPADEHFRLPVGALQEAVRRDRAEGWAPMAVVASAGTVNTGAVDPLHPIADLCREENLWLHVDGAVGALARIAPSVAAILDGLGRADSVAFDFHKWLYVPYEAGCVLVRDEAAHRRTFAVPSAAYLSAIPRGLGGPSLRAGDLGLQLSRGFKALKVWMSLREAGVARYREAIEANLSLARALERRVREAPDLELAHPSDLAIVCFRYRPSGSTELSEVPDPAETVVADGKETYADRVNREILMTLHERGIAAPSHTVLRNRFYLRCAITNHRTRTADLDTLLDAVRQLGHSLEASGELERVETAP